MKVSCDFLSKRLHDRMIFLENLFYLAEDNKRADF